MRQTAPQALKHRIVAAARFWERWRLLYNGALTAIVLLWVVTTWPHFRPAMTTRSLLLIAPLAFLANLGYCAAYLVDVPMQGSALRLGWRKRRWILWSVGMLLAVLLENYWIADEIYPYVS